MRGYVAFLTNPLMPMSTEKHDLETGALTQFSEVLATLWGERRLLFHELRNPPEPDGFCSLDGQPLHIEVGHIYGTQADAKRLLGREGKSAATIEESLRSSLVPLDTRLLTSLNQLLARKATKIYQAQRVWLLIRSVFPLCSVGEFYKKAADIAIPNSHPFEQIWLLCGPRSSYGALRIA